MLLPVGRLLIGFGVNCEWCYCHRLEEVWVGGKACSPANEASCKAERFAIYHSFREKVLRKYVSKKKEKKRYEKEKGSPILVHTSLIWMAKWLKGEVGNKSSYSWKEQRKLSFSTLRQLVIPNENYFLSKIRLIFHHPSGFSAEKSEDKRLVISSSTHSMPTLTVTTVYCIVGIGPEFGVHCLHLDSVPHRQRVRTPSTPVVQPPGSSVTTGSCAILGLFVRCQLFPTCLPSSNDL